MEMERCPHAVDCSPSRITSLRGLLDSDEGEIADGLEEFRNRNGNEI